MRRVDLDQNPALDIAVGGDAVWAALFSNRAKRVDASSAQVTAEFYTGAFSFAIALDRSAVWLAGADRGQLWKIHPVTGSTLLTSRAGHGSTAVALGSGAVWVASWSDRAIVRVDPATGDVLATIPVGGEPHDVVARRRAGLGRGPAGADELTLRGADVTRDDPLTEPDELGAQRSRHLRTDAPETRTALAEREHCRVVGANPAAAHLPHQLEERGVVVLQDAGEDVRRRGSTGRCRRRYPTRPHPWRRAAFPGRTDPRR